MLSLFSAKRSPQPPQTPPAAERYAALAEESRQAGDLASAVEYYRAALDHAPLSRPLRESFAEVLLEAAEQRPARKPKSSRPSQPAPEAPPPRKPSESGVEWRKLALGRSPASKPAARDKAASRRPHKSRRKVFLAASVYVGVSLLLLGVAHGLISHAFQPAELPEVPAVEPLPDALAATLEAATEALTSGDPQKAVAMLEGASEEFPGSAEIVDAALARSLRAVGNRHLDAQEYEKAATTFERATRVDPLNADNWIELARSCREHGRRLQSGNTTAGRQQLERAIAAYDRALELSANDPAALIGLAQVHAFLNDRNKAVSHYKRVIESHPESAEAQLARRHLSQLTGRS